MPAAWGELNVGSGPSAREDHTWTVNGDGTTAYLFGGRGPDGALGDLWEYDLATDSWSQPVLVDTPQPRARFGHTATWVPGVGLVIWSGQLGSGFFADMWAYNPETTAWTELPALGSVPDARYGSCASFGPDGELWISHGFTSSGRFDDTRSYNFGSGTWTDRTPAGELPVERCLHDCFWAPDGHLILYAGQTNGVAALGDIWAYDVADGTWSPGPEPAAPARQLYALSALDPATFGVLVFGGAGIDGDYLGDTWALDWGSLGLHGVDAPAGPTARSGATLIRDPHGDRYLLFGGRNADGERSDLWELAGSS